MLVTQAQVLREGVRGGIGQSTTTAMLDIWLWKDEQEGVILPIMTNGIVHYQIWSNTP